MPENHYDNHDVCVKIIRSVTKKFFSKKILINLSFECGFNTQIASSGVE